MASPGTIIAVGQIIADLALTLSEIRQVIEVSRGQRVSAEAWESLFKEWDEVREEIATPDPSTWATRRP